MKGFTRLKTEVIDCNLCTRCGTCIGVCPVHTLTYRDREILDAQNRCIQCGMCTAVCPGKEFRMDEWSETLFKKPYPADKLLGNYKSIWNACSRRDEIRYRGASGGVVTQMLIDLLEENIIEGAVAVRKKGDSPFAFEPFIAVDKEQVIAAAQSKYMIIPVNEVIRDLKQCEMKVAYVGLPCQIQGMRKAMEQNEWLKEKVVVLISLFCGFNMEKEATDYLIVQSGIPKEKIEELQYRHKKGSNTGLYIKDKKGKEFFISKHGYTFLNLVFSPERCWKCFDYSGEFADISVGDAWEKGQGFSRVIIRTERGERLWETIRKQGMIDAEQTDENIIFKTQNKVVSYKKKQIAIRKSCMRHFPDYGVTFAQCHGKMLIKGMVLYSILTFFKGPIGKRLICVLPFKILIKISNTIKSREV